MKSLPFHKYKVRVLNDERAVNDRHFLFELPEEVGKFTEQMLRQGASLAIETTIDFADPEE